MYEVPVWGCMPAFDVSWASPTFGAMGGLHEWQSEMLHLRQVCVKCGFALGFRRVQEFADAHCGGDLLLARNYFLELSTCPGRVVQGGLYEQRVV